MHDTGDGDADERIEPQDPPQAPVAVGAQRQPGARQEHQDVRLHGEVADEAGEPHVGRRDRVRRHEHRLAADHQRHLDGQRHGSDERGYAVPGPCGGPVHGRTVGVGDLRRTSRATGGRGRIVARHAAAKGRAA